MTIMIHIEQLLLNGVATPGHETEIREAVVRELTERLGASDTLGLLGDGVSVPAIYGLRIDLTGPGGLGREVAASLHHGITRAIHSVDSNTQEHDGVDLS